jgi:protein-arginine kinase activator protein McsA
LNDDNRYKGVFTKVLLKCPNGHYYKTTYNKFKRGMRCGQCYGNKKFSNDVVNEVITSRGFKLLSNYKNMRTKLKLQCPKGHIFYTNFNYFKRTKYGCSECIKGRNFSDKEREIQRYVSKLVKGVV